MAPGIWDTEESMALRKGRRGTTVPLVVCTWVRRLHRDRCNMVAFSSCPVCNVGMCFAVVITVICCG